MDDSVAEKQSQWTKMQEVTARRSKTELKMMQINVNNFIRNRAYVNTNIKVNIEDNTQQ